MSKDFELLRKAELAGKRSRIIDRGEAVPEFTELPKPAEVQACVSPSEYACLSAPGDGETDMKRTCTDAATATETNPWFDYRPSREHWRPGIRFF
jgi:hypothetical protein